MIPTIVPIYAALLAFMCFFLALRVIRLRRSMHIGIGSGGHPGLERVMRVHANFSEYVPLALLLLTFVEMQRNPAWLVHVLAIALLVGRAVHAYGVSQDKEQIRLRTAGMVTTFGVLIASGILLVGGALRAAAG